jgi:hypothetical protein
MLFGFELFSALRNGLGAEIIEVYPFAIVRALLPSCKHKSTEQGYRDQLGAVAARTGWEARSLETRSSRATMPVATGSLTFTKTIGIVRVSRWKNDGRRGIACHDDVGSQADQFLRER